MKALVTTGPYVRHSFFLKKALERFPNSIAGIIRQIPAPSKAKRPSEKAFSNPISEKWISINSIIRRKKASLNERTSFRAKGLAKLLANVPTLDTNNINSTEVLNFITENRADMLIVFGGKILKPTIINEFPEGVLNLHMGLSPDYKGGHCIEWPLYHGKADFVGATVHYIDPGIDSGDILKQTKTNPRPGENPDQIITRSYHKGIELLVDTFDKLNDGVELLSTPQENIGFCYYEKHFTPEIQYGLWKKKQNQATSSLPSRAKNKFKREVFNILERKNRYKSLFPHLPYPAILLYHEIGDGQSPFLRHCNCHVTKERFQEHIDVLGQFYNVVSVEDIYRASIAGNRLEDTIAFTFDDGYKGILTAFKLLEKKGYPAVAYLNSDFADGTDIYWRSKLSWLVEHNHIPLLKAVLENRLQVPCKINSGNAFPWTKERFQNHEIEKAVSTAFARYGNSINCEIYATWDDIKNLDSRLFRFGNHTRRHLNLTSLTKEQQEIEICEGDKRITEKLGKCHAGFSIPNGELVHYNQDTIDIAEKAHEYYLTARGGINVVGLKKEVKRIGIANVDACQLPLILWNNL